MLPTGNLRESRSGAKELVVIVTKCPAQAVKNKLKQSLDLSATVFSCIKYDDFVFSGQLLTI
jgi:hypothetical protein